MSAELVDNLTSAEAGFAYAAAVIGESKPNTWQVDGDVAPPLSRLFEEGGDFGDELVQRLQQGRLKKWKKRRRPAKPKAFVRVVRQAICWVEGDDDTPAIRRRMCRQLVRRALLDYGSDLSVLSDEMFDIRHLFCGTGRQLVGLEMVVVGAVLLACIDEVKVRRRLATILRQLPTTVRRQVEEGLDALGDVEPEVGRRIYEVYSQLADEGWRTDEKLALLGLYFTISASIFRHNGELHRLYRLLPETMHEHCLRYRRACLQSAKPRLSAQVGEVLRPVFVAIAQTGDDTEENTGDDTTEDKPDNDTNPQEETDG